MPIGQKNIKVTLGKYRRLLQFPFITYVYAAWAFDNNNQLIDILVYKEIDAL
jgi:hypothetical protein